MTKNAGCLRQPFFIAVAICLKQTLTLGSGNVLFFEAATAKPKTASGDRKHCLWEKVFQSFLEIIGFFAFPLFYVPKICA